MGLLDLLQDSFTISSFRNLIRHCIKYNNRIIFQKLKSSKVCETSPYLRDQINCENYQHLMMSEELFSSYNIEPETGCGRQSS
jgi:hypothetical protein